jgi:hypothetical protein
LPEEWRIFAFLGADIAKLVLVIPIVLGPNRFASKAASMVTALIPYAFTMMISVSPAFIPYALSLFQKSEI